jgi:serine/threonine protein kinase
LGDKADKDKAKHCPACGYEFDIDLDKCPHDGSVLVKLEEDHLIGTVISDRYEVLSSLGKGGMSLVYKGLHRLMDRPVAIKVVHTHLLSNKTIITRFQQEAQAVSKLHHTNIATVFDFGLIDEKQPYLVMEYLQGESLSEVLDREACLSVERSISLFKQICDGLIQAHDHEIIHRDLKPSNIVLVIKPNGEEIAKVLDFGLAKLLAKGGDAGQHLTQTGEVLGTSYYMSPEQCAGKKIDVRSDIYAVGCLMYETLVGLPPFVGENVLETLQKHITDEIPVFSSVRSDIAIPEELQAVIFKALAKDPIKRFQTVRDLRAALDELPTGELQEHARVGSKAKSESSSDAPGNAESPIDDVDKASADSGSGKGKRFPVVPGIAITLCGVLLLLAMGIWITANNRANQAKEVVLVWKDCTEAGQKAYESGNFKLAEQHFRNAVEEAQNPGMDPKGLLISLRKLGDVLYVEEKYEEAQEIDGKVADLTKGFSHDAGKAGPKSNVSSSGGEDAQVKHEKQKTSDRLSKLAQMCHQKGQCDKAERLLKRSVEVSKEVFGEDSPEVSERFNDLATYYMSMGQYEKAEPLLEKVLSNKGGAEHPVTLKGSQVYAKLLQETARPQEAAKLESSADR